MPYLKQLYQRYHAHGLIIIGVHAPEFAFEHDKNNVQQAVKRLAIPYPVALDNHFSTWRQFQNHNWPAHYLINQQGQVVYQHFGEGDYDILDNNIRYLLHLKQMTLIPAITPPIAGNQTPETYLGYQRASFIHAPFLFINQRHRYQWPTTLPRDAWALQGQWQVQAQAIIATEAKAAIKIHFYARKVYAVMGTASAQPLTVTIRYQQQQHRLKIQQHRLYTLATLPQIADGELEIISQQPELMIYTFTFGD